MPPLHSVYDQTAITKCLFHIQRGQKKSEHRQMVMTGRALMEKQVTVLPFYIKKKSMSRTS